MFITSTTESHFDSKYDRGEVNDTWFIRQIVNGEERVLAIATSLASILRLNELSVTYCW